MKQIITLLTLLLLFQTPYSNALEPQRECRAVPFNNVQLTDNFWAPRMLVNQTVSVPHNINWCENLTGRINNFAIAADQKEGKFSGIYFDDSDVYKILEGFAYSLSSKKDVSLRTVSDRWIKLIAAAQEEDGYLMCYFSLVKPNEKWTNLAGMHELYCAGHLAEAAVAWQRATGDDSLVKVSRRQMDLICKRYGSRPGQLVNVAGHEEIELALVKLYELTGEKKYLEEAKFFIDARGVKENREKGLFGEYCQDHMPLRDQTEIVGHAVRAMYLYAGATDVAGYYQDKELMAAMKRLWANVTLKKMYVTGGIGSHAKNEGFGAEYFLPNQSAYAETCAAIGLILWAHRMNLATGEAKYAKIMRQVMYNGMLSGYGMGGDLYFYVNPLASKGSHHRQPFFGCACCPSNVIRMIGSLPGYVYATTQSPERKKAGLKGDDTILVNMYVNGKATIELADGTVEIEQKTNWPFDGRIDIIANAKPKANAPKDAKYRIVYDYTDTGLTQYRGGEASFTGTKDFHLGTTIELPVERIIANPKVEDDNGRVALQRGPLVYCFEQCDNEVPVDRIILAKDPEFKVELRKNFISGEKDNPATKESPMRTVAVITCKDYQGRKLTAIPYYAWDNRAAGKMAVWVLQQGLTLKTETNWTDAQGEPILYQPLNVKKLGDEIPSLANVRWFNASFAADSHSSFDGSDPDVKPSDSGDQRSPRATFWDHRGTNEWFEYEYTAPMTFTSTSVYWFDDTGKGQCRVPKEWKVIYQEKDGAAWKEVEVDPKTPYSVDRNREITVQFKPVTAQRIRLAIRLQDNYSGGILKWNVGLKK